MPTLAIQTQSIAPISNFKGSVVDHVDIHHDNHPDSRQIGFCVGFHLLWAIKLAQVTWTDQYGEQWPLLLTWFNFDPGMDK